LAFNFVCTNCVEFEFEWATQIKTQTLIPLTPLWPTAQASPAGLTRSRALSLLPRETPKPAQPTSHRSLAPRRPSPRDTSPAPLDRPTHGTHSSAIPLLPSLAATRRFRSAPPRRPAPTAAAPRLAAPPALPPPLAPARFAPPRVAARPAPRQTSETAAPCFPQPHRPFFPSAAALLARVTSLRRAPPVSASRHGSETVAPPCQPPTREP
jgi:hypothetical protein